MRTIERATTNLRRRLTFAALLGLVTLCTATASADVKSFHGSICQDDGDGTAQVSLAYDWYGVKVHEDTGADLTCPLFRDRYSSTSLTKAAVEIDNATGGEATCWLYASFVTGTGNLIYDYSMDTTTGSGFRQLNMPGFETPDVYDTALYVTCELGDDDVLGHIFLEEHNLD